MQMLLGEPTIQPFQLEMKGAWTEGTFWSFFLHVSDNNHGPKSHGQKSSNGKDMFGREKEKRSFVAVTPARQDVEDEAKNNVLTIQNEIAIPIQIKEKY